MLRNKECPFCREIFLPIDRIQGSMNLKKITELIRAQQHRSAHCYYCLEHGVVRPPNYRRQWEKEDLQAIQDRSESFPDLVELAKMRGIQEDGPGPSEDGVLFCQPVVETAQSTVGVSSLVSDGGRVDGDDDDDDEQEEVRTNNDGADNEVLLDEELMIDVEDDLPGV